MDLNILLDAFCHRAARLITVLARQINNDVMNGKPMQEAWNNALVAMSRASKSYSLYLLVRNFMEGIDEEERSNALRYQEATVLRDLARLFALYTVISLVNASSG